MLFTHVAIKQVILELMFNEKSRPAPIAVADLESLNPIPVETMAYASTVVLLMPT